MVKRSRNKKRIEIDRFFLEKIRSIKSHHPFWGYRRIWAYLTYRENYLINKKRVYRIMQENHLLVSKNTRLKAIRKRLPRKPRASRPKQFWGIDMTKVKTEQGWAYIVLVLDWYTKKIVRAKADRFSKTSEWKEVLDQALCKEFPQGSREQGLKLISDNGCQPTSKAFMKNCNHLGVKQIFTSFCNPKGNAETERMMRTMKEELFWLKEWKSINQVQKHLQSWQMQYNKEYLHSSLGYMSPEKFEEKWYEKNLHFSA